VQREVPFEGFPAGDAWSDGAQVVEMVGRAAEG
jgi:hypothetical protein